MRALMGKENNIVCTTRGKAQTDARESDDMCLKELKCNHAVGAATS